MPIYEYRCPKCGDFESMQRISDPPLKACPTCRRKVTKLISSTSFQLKGSGWYITDYARKGGGDSTKTGESAKSGDGKKADGAKKADGGKPADAGEAGASSKEPAASDTKTKKKTGGEKAAAA